MRFRTATLFVSALLQPPTYLLAQNASDYVSSVTANPPVVAPDAPNTIVSVTVTPDNGLPVSSLDGMLVDTGAAGPAPLKDGVASATAYLGFVGHIDSQFTASFPYVPPYPPVSGPAPSMEYYQILRRWLGFATALDGDYVFSIHSSSGNGASRAGEGVSIGALTFHEDDKGNKNVTGELDYNGKLGSFQALPVTGSYTLDGNGRGTVTLRSTVKTQHFDVFVDPEQLADDVQSAKPGGVVKAVLVETDGPFLAGSGTLTARSPGSALNPLNGYTLDLTGSVEGQTPFPLRASLTGGVDLQLGFGPNLPDTAPGMVDLVSGTYVRQGVPLTVTAVSSDAQNRYTYRFTTPNQPAQQPSSFVGYQVDGNHLLLMSTDPVPNTVLLSEEASRP